ncbi:MAG: GatB/YqeY domain-containing protein, partial [Actinomycetales bacterium]
MSLKEKLQNDLTAAMRARDEVKSSTIRMVLTAIKNEEVSGKEARDLSDAEVITVLSREAKKRREAAEEFAKAGRTDKAAEEKSEGEVIAKYLPAQLT